MTVKVRSIHDTGLRGVATGYSKPRMCFRAQKSVRVVWANYVSTVEWRRLDSIVFIVPAGRRVIE